jgi:hypothetical protein
LREEEEEEELSKEDIDQLAKEHNEDILNIEIVSRKLELFLLSLAEGAAGISERIPASDPIGRQQARTLTKRDCEVLCSFIAETVRSQAGGSESLVAAIEAAILKRQGADIVASREGLIHDIDDLLYDELVFNKVLSASRLPPTATTSTSTSAPAPAPVTIQEKPEPSTRAAATGRFSPIAHVSRPGIFGDAESVKSETDMSKAATKGSESLPSVSDTESITDEDGFVHSAIATSPATGYGYDEDEDETTAAPIAADDIPADFSSLGLAGDPDGEIKPSDPSHAAAATSQVPAPIPAPAASEVPLPAVVVVTAAPSSPSSSSRQESQVVKDMGKPSTDQAEQPPKPEQ